MRWRVSSTDASVGNMQTSSSDDVETSGELNLLAALDVLATMKGQDLVTVESGDETVRIWIDDSSTIED